MTSSPVVPSAEPRQKREQQRVAEHQPALARRQRAHLGQAQADDHAPEPRRSNPAHGPAAPTSNSARRSAAGLRMRMKAPNVPMKKRRRRNEVRQGRAHAVHLREHVVAQLVDQQDGHQGRSRTGSRRECSPESRDRVSTELNAPAIAVVMKVSANSTMWRAGCAAAGGPPPALPRRVAYGRPRPDRDRRVSCVTSLHDYGDGRPRSRSKRSRRVAVAHRDLQHPPAADNRERRALGHRRVSVDAARQQRMSSMLTETRCGWEACQSPRRRCW